MIGENELERGNAIDGTDAVILVSNILIVFYFLKNLTISQKIRLEEFKIIKLIQYQNLQINIK